MAQQVTIGEFKYKLVHQRGSLEVHESLVQIITTLDGGSKFRLYHNGSKSEVDVWWTQGWTRVGVANQGAVPGVPQSPKPGPRTSTSEVSGELITLMDAARAILEVRGQTEEQAA